MCAGKTHSSSLNRFSTRAHPRVCGENAGLQGPREGLTGSSPRVRGKLGWPGRNGMRRGLIPACAGKQLRRDVRSARLGLIPACAGKTSPTIRCGSRSKAHPRVCGENIPIEHVKIHDYGSSPRVRGKQGAARRDLPTERLIPACAGKTDAPIHWNRHRQAHPRVCGENVTLCGVRVSEAGSSPRVRGKRGEGGQGLESGRLIPACAGKTSLNRPLTPRARAHPRVCGENTICRSLAQHTGGSSPRVRGKH